MNNQYFYPNFNPGYMRGPVGAINTMSRALPITPTAFANPTTLSSFSAPSSLLSGLSRAPAASAIASTGAAAKSFSWTGLLNGASKTLGVINQAIPVVYQVKPIWNNAKTMFRVVKELNKSDTPNHTSNSNTNAMNSTTSSNHNSNNSNTATNNHNNNNDLPTFFH